jgi:2-hydroxy-4-carboxymuconate semialdehyde hemiacetal dehydrogenase
VPVRLDADDLLTPTRGVQLRVMCYDRAVLQRLGLCIVGPGAIAEMHMRALTALEACTHRWVVGDVEDATARFADKWGFPNKAHRLDEALADDSVDVVFVTSPSAFHVEHTRAALTADKHVACEIPAALSLADAENLAHLAASKGKRLQVCHSLRAHPAFSSLREQVASGTLTIAQMLSVTANKRRNNENWDGGTRAWIDNLLWHHACHAVDMSLWILGMPVPTEVYAQAGHTNSRFGMTMDLALGFKTETSQLVTHVLTYNSPVDFGEWRFVTDHDFLLVRDGVLEGSDGQSLVTGHEWWDLQVQDDAIVQAISSGEPSDFDVETVLPTMQVLQRCEELSGVQ